MNSPETYYERFLTAECHYQQLLLNPNHSVALSNLKQQAHDGNVWAIVRLAGIYLAKSDDQEHLYHRGVEMLTNLSEQGFAFAQYKLADHYITCEKPRKAIRLLKGCLKAHIPEAALLLAELLEESDPYEADEYRELAKRWGAFDTTSSERMVDDDSQETATAPSYSVPSRKIRSISDVYDEIALKGLLTR